MKKFIVLLTTLLTLAFAASCFATENSSALNSAENSATIRKRNSSRLNALTKPTA